MRIGIIGAGAIGQTVGRLLAASGHEILVSWVSTDARLRNAAERIGPGTRTGTPADAARHAEAVLFAPRFEHAVSTSAAGS
jgi:predicted dinucleotide-binding enzyme